jgi:LuxR family maltose regulon positive regulatory protein
LALARSASDVGLLIVIFSVDPAAEASLVWQWSPVYPPLDIDSMERSIGQSERAEDAVEMLASWWPLVSPTHGARLRAMIEGIPESAWGTDLRILGAMGASYRSLDSRNHAAALLWFSAAEAAQSDRDDVPGISTVLLHHAAALRSLGRLDSALEKSAAAFVLLDGLRGPPTVRVRGQSRAALQLGLTQLQLGDYTGAQGMLELAGSFGDRHLSQPEFIECLSGLSVLSYLSGDLTASTEMVATARTTSGTSGFMESCFGAGALTAEVLVAIARNDRSPVSELVNSMSVAAHGSDWEPLAHVARASASAMDGDFIGGLGHIRRGLERSRGWQGDPAVRGLCETVSGELLMHLGEFAAARAVFGAVEPDRSHTVCPARLIAGIRYKAGDNSGCLQKLSECESLGESHSARTAVDVLVLRAAANYELGNAAAADVALDRALQLSVGSTIRNPFLLVSGAHLHRMLTRAKDRHQGVNVLDLIDQLRASDHGSTAGILEPLSLRERDVARHLSQDKTMGQIASDLYISTNTVKSHVRSIYRKLSANNRQDAVRRGSELGAAEITLP